MKKAITRLIGHYLNTLHAIAPEPAAAHGFRVFCYPYRSSLKRYQRNFLDPARYERLEVAGNTVQLYKWGIGKKNILFLHGWQSHSFRWKAYVESFPLDQYTIYALDAPGHGLSSGSFLTVPLYSTIVEQVIQRMTGLEAIIAHSLGAFTALYTLSRLALLPVRKLVLLAPPGEATEFLDFYRSTLGLRPNMVKSVAEHFERVIGAPVDSFSAPAFAATLRQPGLLIHDEEDQDTSFRHAILIHQAWQRSELVLTRGLGHNLKSRDIVERVLAFVEGAPVRELAGKR